MPVAPTPSSDPVLEAHLLWVKYRNAILGGLVLLVLGVVGFAGYRLYQERRENEAAAAFSAAKTAADYQQVMNKYPGTPPAAAAHLLLAERQRQDGAFADANRTLQAFAEKFPKHELISTAKMAIAANLQSLGKQDEALAMYQQIASVHAESFNAPLALLAQVQILQQKNRPEDARRICETIITQYRDSVAAFEAQRLLQSLKPAGAVVSPAGTPVSGSPPAAKP